MEINIITDYESSVAELLTQCKKPEIGKEYFVSQDLSIMLLRVMRQSGMVDGNTSVLISCVINIGTSITAGVAARWIYDTLKGRAKKVVVDSESVEIEIRKIEEIIIRKSS